MNSKQKLLTLLVSTIVVITTLSILLVKAEKSKQYELNNLYFASFIPVNRLHTLQQTLEKELLIKLYSANEQQRKTLFLTKELRNATTKIEKLWKAYALSYKSNDEKAYITHVDGFIYKLLDYIASIIETLQQKELTDIQALEPIKNSIMHVTGLIEKLIEYENNVAGNKRKELYEGFSVENIIITLSISSLVALILILFYVISQSINATERRLKALTHHLQAANEELHLASITDGLTTLYNRRYFDQIFTNELLRAQRDNTALAFLMLDIDHFKLYNDHYGHPAGDDVITQVAAHLKAHFKRPTDLIFRLGGEEFGVLINRANKEYVAKIARQMVKEMQQLNIAHTKSKTQPYVTLSVGLLYVSNPKEITASKLYEVCDSLLYKAKESGRNQVVESSF